MTRRRWIADEFTSTHATLLGDHADHLSRILRARIGQEFDITTAMTVRRGRITLITQDRVEFELGETVPVAPATNVTLLLSIFKFNRMEWAMEKCTELGVSRIVPVIAHRTESHLASASARRLERWQRIALQAAEQSRRLSPPEISQPIKLAEAISLSGDQKIVLAEFEQEAMLREILKPASSTLLSIGPEGGWTPAELESFRSACWTPASLGDTILRAETAAIAATVLTISAQNK